MWTFEFSWGTVGMSTTYTNKKKHTLYTQDVVISKIQFVLIYPNSFFNLIKELYSIKFGEVCPAIHLSMYFLMHH